jgi:hypothetical protein
MFWFFTKIPRLLHLRFLKTRETWTARLLSQQHVFYKQQHQRATWAWTAQSVHSLKARRLKYCGTILGWKKINVSSLMHTAGSVPGGREAGPEADHSAIQCRYYFCMRLFKLHKSEPPTSSAKLSLSQPDRRVCTNTVRHCTWAINDTVHDFTERYYHMATLFSFTLF